MGVLNQVFYNSGNVLKFKSCEIENFNCIQVVRQGLQQLKQVFLAMLKIPFFYISLK